MERIKMDNMNKQKPIATDISQWNNCTEIIYKCPRCGQEFPTKNLTYPKKENNFFYCSKERKIQ